MGSARNERDARVGFVGGLILKRIMTLPWALAGVMAIALFGAGTIEPDHAFGAMARSLLPAGFAGLMIACVLASVMDNLAVFMLSFAGIYCANIHPKLFGSRGGEREMIQRNRAASVAFGLLVIMVAYVFPDVPAAMRFMWKTVPLMGIAFFLALLWRRANRYGAFASFAAALIALLAAQHGLGWTGDAGLPKLIGLYLGAGLSAGILVSWLTPPEPADRLDRFYLLLNTPIGQEDRLRAVGFLEIPGTGTFEDPGADAPPIPVGASYARRWGRSNLEIARPGRQAWVGGSVVAVMVVAMTVGLVLFARWLATG